jgi:hypothetical protein
LLRDPFTPAAVMTGQWRPGFSFRRLTMVTRSASSGLLGLKPAGPRLLLAAARLPHGAMAFLANLER